MWDSNPHGLRHQILSLACLPISAIARDVAVTQSAARSMASRHRARQAIAMLLIVPSLEQ